MSIHANPDAGRALLTEFVQQRSERAFKALYDAHAPAMYALARRILGGADSAEDVLQDAWLRALTRAAAFRADSSVRTWLCGFVVNCCRERLRIATWEELPDLVAPDLGGPAIDLERAIAELPPGFRSVLLLHDLEGYTHEEIGRLLRIEPGTSKSQLSRARRALRGRLRTVTRETAR